MRPFARLFRRNRSKSQQIIHAIFIEPDRVTLFGPGDTVMNYWNSDTDEIVAKLQARMKDIGRLDLTPRTDLSQQSYANAFNQMSFIPPTTYAGKSAVNQRVVADAIDRLRGNDDFLRTQRAFGGYGSNN